MKPPRVEEQLVRTLLERLFPDDAFTFIVDQSSSRADFHWVRDGETIPLEVTSIVDPERRAFEEVWERSQRIVRKKATRDWWIWPSDRANLRRLERELDDALWEIEQLGILEFTDLDDIDAVQRVCTKLRISHGRVFDGVEKGFLSIATPTQSSIGSLDPLVSRLGAEAAREDNRSKLRAGPRSSGELFVVVDDTAHQMRHSMIFEALPFSEPTLPPEVARLWVATRTRDADEHIVWSFDAHTGWKSWGRIRVDAQSE